MKLFKKLFVVVLAILMIGATACESLLEPDAMHEENELTDLFTFARTGDADGTDKTTLYIDPNTTVTNPALTRTAYDKNTLLVANVAGQGRYNPLFTTSASDIDVLAYMFESPLTADYAGELQPEQLTEYPTIEKVEANGTYTNDVYVYTMKLRSDLKWQDGTAVTADDFILSWRIYADGTYAEASSAVGANVYGAEEYKNATLTASSTRVGLELAGVKKVSDTEFTIAILASKHRADSILAINLNATQSSFYKSIYEANGVTDTLKAYNSPRGNGLFKLDSINSTNKDVTMVLNTHHRDAANCEIKKIIAVAYTDDSTASGAFLSGAIDMYDVAASETNVFDVHNKGFIAGALVDYMGYGYYAFNFHTERNSPVLDKKVRQAIVYGHNRDLANSAYWGAMASTLNVPFSSVSWAYPEDTSSVPQYKYNVDKANELLDSAGWTTRDTAGYRTKSSKRLTLKILVMQSVVNASFVPILTADMKAIGIEVVTENVDFSAMITGFQSGTIKDKYDMVFAGSWGLTLDPGITGLFHTQDVDAGLGLQNYHGYSNLALDALMVASDLEFDKEERKEMFAEITAIWTDDLPYMLMYQRKNFTCWNARLGGIADKDSDQIVTSFKVADIKDIKVLA